MAQPLKKKGKNNEEKALGKQVNLILSFKLPSNNLKLSWNERTSNLDKKQTILFKGVRSEC